MVNSVSCYIGLGANLAEPMQAFQAALMALATHPSIGDVHCSKIYHSKPMGPQNQPDYTNAVASFSTCLAPLALLDLLQAIELKNGRERKERWGPRTLDLDLLLYGQQCINEPRLSVPHPGLELREFVLVPLAELAPQLTLPNGKLVAQLAAQIDHNGLQVLAAAPTLHSCAE